MRPVFSWIAIGRLRRIGTSKVSEELLEITRRVSKRLGIARSVAILQSSLVEVPLVVGYLRPMILLPIGLLSNLPMAQLEAIIAHELAHVRRHDFLTNFLQTVVETLFFYHPAIWWFSKRIRIEREHCCDDLAIQVLGNRIEYGRALVAVEKLRGESSVLALSVADGSMLARVRRIVGQSGNGQAASRWTPLNILASCLIVVAISGLLAWHVKLRVKRKRLIHLSKN
jgi:beta-lactamase regulating signal transducer with metallopeptidase domain